MPKLTWARLHRGRYFGGQLDWDEDGVAYRALIEDIIVTEDGRVTFIFLLCYRMGADGEWKPCGLNEKSFRTEGNDPHPQGDGRIMFHTDLVSVAIISNKVTVETNVGGMLLIAS